MTGIFYFRLVLCAEAYVDIGNGCRLFCCAFTYEWLCVWMACFICSVAVREGTVLSFPAASTQWWLWQWWVVLAGGVGGGIGGVAGD
jgi:hypothetical protein